MAQQGAFPPPESPPPNGGGEKALVIQPYVPPPPPESLAGPLAPQQGRVVTDQRGGVGRYSRNLIPFAYKLDVAKPVDQAKHEPFPGNALQVLIAQGGSIPDDARISIGGSNFFPLVEGWSYESDEPFDGFDVYWPTNAGGVTVWILLGLGRPTMFRR